MKAEECRGAAWRQGDLLRRETGRGRLLLRGEARSSGGDVALTGT